MSRTLQGTKMTDGDVFEMKHVPGAWRLDDDRRSIWYACPCCGELRNLPISEGEKAASAWLWDGNRDAPTLSPSIWHRGDLCNPPRCTWHGFLRAGVWVWA